MFTYTVLASNRHADTYEVTCDRKLTCREIEGLLYNEYGDFDDDGRLLDNIVRPAGEPVPDLDHLFPGLTGVHVRNDTVGSEIIEIEGPL